MICKKSNGFFAKDLDIFEDMLYADALRGMDSTGVITVERDGGFHIDKEGTASYEFLLDYPKTESRKNVIQHGVALIGHNRKGTVGAISDETAHPFVVNKTFAMVHNGTLYNHKALAETTVDSEALTITIKEALAVEYSGDESLRESFYIGQIEEALGRVSGAYAVVWYNQETNKIQFVRNDQRPLWIGETDDFYLLASEGGLINWVVNRNGYKWTRLVPTDHDTLYTIQMNDRGEGKLSEEKLNIKKYYHTTQTTQQSGMAVIGAAGTSKINKNTSVFAKLSKNEFKRLKRKLIQREVEFFAVDYVETHLCFGLVTSTQDYIVMGESEGLGGIPHLIKGEINLKKLKLDIDNIDEPLYRGTIVDMEYDMKLSQADITVEKISIVKPVLLPKPEEKKNANEENTTTVH